ncbi:hypothetical protein GW17_00015110 [Ensete ventricosum]|nr:hypothetical protein GW17_00015110 [Ensete ventricosum]
MGIDASNGQTDNPTKKKTTNQLQSLENFYSGVTFPYPVGSLMAGISSRCATERMYQLVRKKARHKVLEQLTKSQSVGRINHTDKDQVLLQILLSKDSILKKIFRKDGPTLGFEFDAAPGNAVGYHTELQEPEPCHGKLQTAKRSKRQSSQRKSQERRKSTRIGKLEVSYAYDWFWGMLFLCLLLTFQVSLGKDMNQKESCLKNCKLFLDKFSEQSSELIDLVDDEELELKELQVGSNSLRCSAHLASNGRHGCPLCKGWLLFQFFSGSALFTVVSCFSCCSSYEISYFAFYLQVVQFILTHSVTIEADPFTLDEFVQAFHDKVHFLQGLFIT